MVRRLFAINFIDAFISGITTVAIPLLMLEHGIDLATIGIAFSLMPLAKLIVRLTSSAAADSIGERVFYCLNSLSNLGQAVVYAFFTTATGFATGKILDGAKESFIWSVNRTSVMATMPHKAHYALGEMVSGRLIYNGIGSLAVGLLFPFGGFDLLLALIAVLSLITLAESLKVRNVHAKSEIKLSDFSIFGRERRFYETITAMTFGSSFYMPIVYVIIPLFFSLSGFSLEQIGVFYAIYFLIFGAVLNVLSSRKVRAGVVGITGAAIFAVSLFGMAFADTPLAPAFFFFMAFGDACLALLWEELVYLQAKDSRKKSTEIALIHTPAHVGIIVVSAASGFIMEHYGFAPLFVVGALFLVSFGFWGIRLSGVKPHRLCPEWLIFSQKKG